MIHQLKSQRKFFEEKIAGRKAWELRFGDRNFAIGDYIGENEIDEAGQYTGRFVIEKIVDIVYPSQVPGGLEKGYVILSTSVCSLITLDEELRCNGIDISVYGGEEVEDEQKETDNTCR